VPRRHTIMNLHYQFSLPDTLRSYNSTYSIVSLFGQFVNFYFQNKGNIIKFLIYDILALK